ncbi:hypothetical protein SAMN05216327_117135 [Dyadobacter sp. SG02]|uniref:hypothetical protein n=1 Tax=Dyadobacter sp. SG02 TaxID=1855291 RepID=UPI0008D20229|nr:hypothetical protein [Dyadobacter sp. SG02]SEJ73080.1 hypothetical protein SAMN05216327_117135 [Dyadobacter sp. SG02]
MKIRRKVLVVFLFLGGLLGCKDNDSEVNPGNGNGGGATEVGIPNGDVATKRIGTAGGTITSSDNQVTLTIPAGALSKETEISIQPITNEAPNGLGLAYRFSPDGTAFTKPASLTFHYDSRRAASPDAFRIATQGTDRRWYHTSKVTVDRNARTITTEMPHFSDWTAYEMFMIEDLSLQGADYVELGASIDLQVLFANLVIPIKLPGETETPNIEMEHIEFSVLGGSANGSIKATGGRKFTDAGDAYPARFTAPSANPPSNPVTVVADVTLKGTNAKIQLVKQILIGKDYFRGTFDGKPYNWENLVFAKTDDALLIGGWNDNPAQSLNIELHHVNFDAPNRLYAYGALVDTEAWAEFSETYSNTGGGFISSNFDCVREAMRVSPGGVNITQISIINGVEYIQGTITGTFYNLPGPCPAALRPKDVTGEFRIRNTAGNGRQTGKFANFKGK